MKYIFTMTIFFIWSTTLFAQYIADNDRAFSFPTAILPASTCSPYCSCPSYQGVSTGKTYYFGTSGVAAGTSAGIVYTDLKAHQTTWYNTGTAGGCVTNTSEIVETADWKYVNVIDFEAKTTTSLTVCPNDSKDLKSELTYSSGVTWSGNFVGSSGVFTPPVISSSQTYTITATKVFDNGTSTISFSVYVPANDFTFSELPDICANGNSISLQGYTSKTTSFSGSGVSGTNFNPSSATAGTHAITAKLTVNGCANSIIRNIKVKPISSVEAGTDLELCAGEAVVDISGNASPSEGTWSSSNANFNNSINSTEKTLNLSGIQSGSYTLDYAIDLDGCITSDSKNVTVLSSSPDYDPQIEADVTQINVGKPVTFTTNLNNIQSIDWDFGDGSPSDKQTVVHYFNASGIYNVSIEFVLENGCSGDYKVDNMITVEGNVTGVSDFNSTEKSPMIYPVPFSDVLYSQNLLQKNKSYRLMLHDTSGKLLIDKNIIVKKEESVIFNKEEVNKLESGIYMLTIMDDLEYLITYKILK